MTQKQHRKMIHDAIQVLWLHFGSATFRLKASDKKLLKAVEEHPSGKEMVAHNGRNSAWDGPQPTQAVRLRKNRRKFMKTVPVAALKPGRAVMVDGKVPDPKCGLCYGTGQQWFADSWDRDNGKPCSCLRRSKKTVSRTARKARSRI